MNEESALRRRVRWSIHWCASVFVGAFGALTNGIAATVLYAWFATPVGAPSLSFATITGATFAVRMVTRDPIAFDVFRVMDALDCVPTHGESAKERIVESVVRPLNWVAIGGVIHVFMGWLS